MVRGTNFSRTLVVVAHPDDEVLGCGGTIRKLADSGCDVAILIMNNGNTLRGNGEHSDQVKDEAVDVSKYLGVSRLNVKEFKTGSFDSYPQIEFNKVVSDYVEYYEPTCVLTHCENDLHQDHRVVNEAVMVACRSMNSSHPSVMTFPTISSSEVNPNFNFQPNVYFDISNTIERKADAMTLYKAEYDAMPERRGIEAIKIWGAFYGLHVGVAYAECFRLVRSIIL